MRPRHARYHSERASRNPGMGGRVVECSGLENRRRVTFRGLRGPVDRADPEPAGHLRLGTPSEARGEGAGRIPPHPATVDDVTFLLPCAGQFPEGGNCRGRELRKNVLPSPRPCATMRPRHARYHSERASRNPGMGGRVVECSGLENRRRVTFRGFESHPIRYKSNRTLRLLLIFSIVYE